MKTYSLLTIFIIIYFTWSLETNRTTVSLENKHKSDELKITFGSCYGIFDKHNDIFK